MWLFCTGIQKQVRPDNFLSFSIMVWSQVTSRPFWAMDGWQWYWQRGWLRISAIFHPVGADFISSYCIRRGAERATLSYRKLHSFSLSSCSHLRHTSLRSLVVSFLPKGTLNAVASPHMILLRAAFIFFCVVSRSLIVIAWFSTSTTTLLVRVKQ